MIIPQNLSLGMLQQAKMHSSVASRGAGPRRIARSVRLLEKADAGLLFLWVLASVRRCLSLQPHNFILPCPGPIFQYPLPKVWFVSIIRLKKRNSASLRMKAAVWVVE